jgi:hypothetical protein
LVSSVVDDLFVKRRGGFGSYQIRHGRGGRDRL